MVKKYMLPVLAVLLMLVTMPACSKEAAETETTTASIIQTQGTEPSEGTSYTVTFRDHGGQILDTQRVQHGYSAVAPEYTPEEGYQFVGWDRDLCVIMQDTVVNAIYSLTAQQSLMVLEMKARPGETVTVPVVIVNNPGIAGAKVTMLYDPSLTLQDAQSGTAFAYLEYTGPGQLVNPCSFTWDSESGMAKEDGEILRLCFQIPQDAPLGRTYSVKCVYNEGDVYDENLNNVSLGVINGSITVE